jgi:hypothetical protein
MKVEESPVFSPGSFFFAVSLGGIAVNIGCLYFYYLHNPFASLIVKIPLIRQTAVDLPGDRLFSVGMTIVAWLTIPIFLVIDRVVILKFRIAKIPSTFPTAFMALCAVITFVSLIGLSSITLEENSRLHLTCVGLFLIALSAYFFTTDWALAKGRVAIKPADWACDAAPLVCFSASFSLLQWCRPDPLLLSIAGALQYMGGTVLFLKFLIVWFRIPRVGLFLTRKTE